MKLYICTTNYTTILFIAVTLLYVVGIIIHSVSQEIKYYKDFNAFDKIIKESKVSDGTKYIMKKMNSRNRGYIKKYHLFMMFDKVLGAASVTYSVLGVMCVLEKNAETWIAPTINIITATCVTTLLYLAPGMRVGEYLEAWRLSEDGIHKMCRLLDIIDESLIEALKTDVNIDTNVNKILEGTSSDVVSKKETLIAYLGETICKQAEELLASEKK